MVPKNLPVMMLILATILMHTIARVVDTQRITNYAFNNNGLGTYSFEFESSDGTYRKEDGGLITGPHGDTLVVRGEYGYIDPEGRQYTVHYVADENGFQPQSEENDTRFNDRRITYEDVELRRIFPNEFPFDTIRKTGSTDPEQLGRYAELQSYFYSPKSPLNSHFEELVCYERQGKKYCRLDKTRHSLDEDNYYLSAIEGSPTDRRRVYCFMLICFNEDELDRVVASF